MEAPASDPQSEPMEVYLHFRTVFSDGAWRASTTRSRGRASGSTTAPFGSGRDPVGLGDVIDGLSRQLGWTSPLARSELLAAWPRLVGVETATHAVPVTIEDGILTVRCDSTAWATELRRMNAQIVSAIAAEYPLAAVETVRFIGPNTPSWKRGPRTIPGRGPRDTYG